MSKRVRATPSSCLVWAEMCPRPAWPLLQAAKNRQRSAAELLQKRAQRPEWPASWSSAELRTLALLASRARAGTRTSRRPPARADKLPKQQRPEQALQVSARAVLAALREMPLTAAQARVGNLTSAFARQDPAATVVATAPNLTSAARRCVTPTAPTKLESLGTIGISSATEIRRSAHVGPCTRNTWTQSAQAPGSVLTATPPFASTDLLPTLRNANPLRSTRDRVIRCFED
jgi:hypothetical protein